MSSPKTRVRWRTHWAALALPCIFVFSSCATAQDGGEGGPEPIQLAQYPGAPFEDRHGDLWFGTVTEGLIRYDGESFVTYTTEDGLGGNSVRDIVEDKDGTLWFATTGGLTGYDGESFTTQTAYGQLRVKRGFGAHGNHRELWDILIDREGELWIATMDGVFRFDGESFTRFPLPVVAAEGKYEFTPVMVYCITQDNNGDLWFGTDGAGVVRYDGAEMAVYTIESHGLSSDNVCEILQDRRGDYWFGTSNGGVSRFDGTAFTTHLRSKEHSIHTGWGRYMSIIEDRDGDVWFGVSITGGGVYRYDGGTFEYLSEPEGLGSGGVPSIREDRSGNLWFGTTAGVYFYEGARFVNFTKNNPQTPAKR